MSRSSHRRCTSPVDRHGRCRTLRPARRPRRTSPGRAAAALCLAVGAGAVADGATAGSASATTTTTATSRSFAVDGGLLDYCGNGSVAHRSGGIRRVVFVVHGSSGNYCDYARYALDAAAAAGVLGSTLVVAPHFATDPADSGTPRLTWGSGWREGSTSTNTEGPRVSSFAALDALAATVRQTYGAGVRLVVVGHSAGGQLVQRYAEGTDAPFDAFVPMNPSSYAYLSSQRWTEDGTPLSVSGCPGYDTWKYGLVGLNSYMRGQEAIPQRYAAHRVALLLGALDVERDADLDTGCEAEAQGRNRLDRGRRFHAHLAVQLGLSPQGHTLAVVPGVGHDGRAMLASDAATSVLFR